MQKYILGADDLRIFLALNHYRFLTITQAIIVQNNNRSHQSMARRLSQLSKLGFLSSYGGGRMGFMNTQKIYFATRKGFDVLQEYGVSESLIKPFKKTSKPNWSPKTKHRIYLIDLFLSLERSVEKTDFLSLPKIFLEYRFIQQSGKAQSETTDFFNDQDKITPDGSFVLKSNRTGASVLFFVEMDMGTEQISESDNNTSIVNKFKKYEQYFKLNTYQQKYSQYGDFPLFVVLFVTTSETRLNNIRKCLNSLSNDLCDFFLFNTHENILNGFLNQNWLNGNHLDDSYINILG